MAHDPTACHGEARVHRRPSSEIAFTLLIEVAWRWHLGLPDSNGDYDDKGTGYH